MITRISDARPALAGIPVGPGRRARFSLLASITLVGLGAGWLQGCGDSTSPSAVADGGTENVAVGARRIGFLDRVADAPMRVSYGGKRHVEIRYTNEGVPALLEYDEQVWSDGQGRFSIVPGRVASPHMTAEQLDLFQTLQQARDGFLYRYRDFRIRDYALFLQNWRATDTGRREAVAGVTTNVLEFRRIDGSPIWYRAWIDPRTALVMRSEERGPTDALVSHSEFKTFQLSPDTNSLNLEGDQFTRSPLDPFADTTGSLGFQVHAPTILPTGYRLERSESTSDGTNAWAILTYTDGVDTTFFLQTFDPQGTNGQPAQGEFDVGPKVVRGFRIGPWTVLQLRSNGDRVLVLGKADSASVERMLKSAVH